MKQKVKDFIFEYRRKNKSLPSVKVIAVGCDMTTEDVRRTLDELSSDGVLRKYPSKKGVVSSYHIPAVVHMQEEKKIVPEKSLPVRLNKYPAVWLIVQIIMFVIAGAAVVVSSYFSLLWTATFLPLPIAIILSVGMPAYIAIAPEGAVIIKESSGAKSMPLIGWVLLGTAILALFFSMSMSVIGQFNARSELIETKKSELKIDTGKTLKLKVVKEEEKDISERIKSAKEDLKLFQSFQKDFKKEDLKSKDFQKTENEIKKIKNEIQTLSNDIKKNREEQKTLFETGTEQEQTHRYNFYDWFASVTGAASGIIEFILYVIPALFCDLIAPLGVYVAVGLYKKRRKEE